MDKKSRKENKKIVTSIRKDNEKAYPNKGVRKALLEREVKDSQKISGKKTGSKYFKNQY